MGKTKVYQILKNRLEYKYRKTVIKSEKILSNDSLIMANLFVEIFVRGLRLKYNFIYIDESKIQQVNSNLYYWRKADEYLFNEIKDCQKRNLIMVVSPNGLIYYKIEFANTNTDIFLYFLKRTYKYNRRRKKNFIFILYNFRAHIYLIK